VKKETDCQFFEDQLDTLLDGSLSGEGTRQLRLHALSCPDCAMLLRVQEHLDLPPLEELEAAVPEELLASMWPKVQAEVADQRRDVSAVTSFPKRLRWFVPTLAAASIALLFSASFLFSELKRSEARELQLAQQVGELERGLAEVDARTEWVERTASLAGSRRNRARALAFALSGQDSITVETLFELLGSYPADLVLLNASQVDAIMRTTSRPPPDLRGILVALGDALTDLGYERGVRAGDLVEWLASSGLPRDMVLPKSQLIELLS
jgi:hypothetical protein